MPTLLTVLINPLEGREDDFNEWYTHVHIRDAMRFAGSIRVQRLVASATQIEAPRHKYFTIYDTFDPALFSQEHKNAMGTPRMVVSEVYDKSDVINSYYAPLHTRSHDPEGLAVDNQPLILEQITVLAGQEQDFERWTSAVRLPALMAKSGVTSAQFMRFAERGQMFVHAPAYSHIAIYRAADLQQALQGWDDHSEPPFPGIVKRAVTCYEPMMGYLTRDKLILASAEELALEQAARAKASTAMATTESLGLAWK